MKSTDEATNGSLVALLTGANAPRAGRGAALLVTPHLILGTWLLIVPDHFAFRTSQIATLLHVGIAALSVPLVALWVIRHATRMRAPAERQTRWAITVRWGLATMALAATATGGIVVWGGDIVGGHALHAWCGLGLAVPLTLHLWNGTRRRAAAGVLTLLVAATGGAEVARRALPTESLEPTTPAFAFVTKRADLYEPAASCGECHAEQYAEWRRSTHGRSTEHAIVRERFGQMKDSVGFDLAVFGTLVGGGHVPHENLAVGSCEMCHAPTSFYGDDHENPLDPTTGVAAEAITCSFCHTLRAVYAGENRGQPVPSSLQQTDYPHVLTKLPFYVSAPESVRRYLGQGSTNSIVHWISNALIRWRPTVHSHDQHSSVLDSSQACMPCHSNGAFDVMPQLSAKTYYGWEHSAYNTGNPETTITCQDCHLARHLTGGRSSEPGRLVPWGPVHDNHVSHLLLGGNAGVANVLHDEEHQRLEHELNTRVASVDIVGSKVNDSGLDVDVRVTPKLVGHYLPSVAAQNRFFWVQVSAMDAHGQTLGTTKSPERGDDVGGESPVMFRCVEPARPDCDTVLLPDTPRVFTARLPLPPDAQPATLTAELHESVDQDPVAHAWAPYTVSAGEPVSPRAPAPASPSTLAVPPSASAPAPSARQSSPAPALSSHAGVPPSEPTDGHVDMPACAITPEVAKAVFAALAGRRENDRCVLDGVETEQTRMLIHWKKPGADLPAAEVVPSECREQPPSNAGPSLSFTPPVALVQACPASLEAMAHVLEGLPGARIDAPRLALATPSPFTQTTRFKRIALAAGASLAAALVWLALRRRRVAK